MLRSSRLAGHSSVLEREYVFPSILAYLFFFFFVVRHTQKWASRVAQLVKNWPDPGSISGSGRSPAIGTGYPHQYSWASLVAQLIKNPAVMWETLVRSLGWEDPLEGSMVTHSSILGWRIPIDRGA